MELKNPRQAKIYIMTLLTGLGVAYETYERLVEEREEFINKALVNIFSFDDLKKAAAAMEKEPGVRLVREDVDIEEFLNMLADNILGYRFDQLSEEIGNNYEKFLEAYKKGGNQLEIIVSKIEKNLKSWSREDPKGLEDLWKFIEGGTNEGSPFEEIIFGDADFLETYNKAIVYVGSAIFEGHWTEDQRK